MARKIDAAATIVMLAAVIAAAAPLSRAETSPCDDEISKLTPCYSYIEGSSSPASDCCNHLGDVAAAKPECLCQVLHSDNDNLNKTRLMGLPKACNVTTPPVSLCNSSIPSSGYSTKMSNSLQLSIIAASYSSILIFI